MKKRKLQVSADLKLHLQQMRDILAGIPLDDIDLDQSKGGACGAVCMVTCSYYCKDSCDDTCKGACANIFRTYCPSMYAYFL